MTGGVVLTGLLVCANTEEADIVGRLRARHIELTRAEPGCLSFDVVRTDDLLIWQVDERFIDDEAFAFHQQPVRDTSGGE
ncbi:antibiotic biosynthesis monooxygenase [Gordonia sp. LSe1-13]|uniref:Antibiotic biosynthesis monooxygenase n=1 Tax=Gordonia sesuvii TaxID=3116777 RepID=A0ABU7MIB7_9ACTN|nr:antibiotic biosynthesis monooxygenase [Gordonia sp. LSe1-13]